ncbi:MAG: hypothetical protein KC646_10505 [Candidatus Cloacimonetes bacterium]|nr:hypothetical protein [Candidatus Cloacimonadota bacterium]
MSEEVVIESEENVNQVACQLCQSEIEEGAEIFLNGNKVCNSCKNSIEQELKEEIPNSQNLIMGCVGGLLGAIVSGLIWAGIVVATDYEIGYVAIGVGWLTGLGVSTLSGGKKSQSLQIVAAINSVIGLLIAKYIMFAHYLIPVLKKQENYDADYFDPILISIFPENVSLMLNGFDALWVILALSTAYSILAPTKLDFDKPVDE